MRQHTNFSRPGREDLISSNRAVLYSIQLQEHLRAARLSTEKKSKGHKKEAGPE